MSFLLIALGVVLLYYGGDLLVSGAGTLASRLGISRLVIGLTVVAFGTSAPELAATVTSALQGVPELAIGNVIGSNIANIALILGAASVLYALQSNWRFLRVEMMMMVAVSALLIPLFWDGRLSRLEGAVLLLLLTAYLWYMFTGSQRALPEVETASDAVPLWRSIAGVVVGVLLLVGGAQALVTGAVSVARAMGVSEAVIGLTLIAFGTSLPELASSMVAALKRESEMILGNIVGSNIFNVLAVLGITAIIKPLEEPFALVRTDIFIMLGFSVALPLLMLSGSRLGRVEGSFLLLAYAGFVVGRYLF